MIWLLIVYAWVLSILAALIVLVWALTLIVMGIDHILRALTRALDWRVDRRRRRR